VLVADTKITVDNGRRYEYQDKLITEFQDLLSVVIGFSANKEPFTEFRMRLRPRISELEEEFHKKNKVSTDKINLMIIEIMRSLKTHYNNQTYDVIAGITGKPTSTLHYFYQEGFPEEITTYKEIGNSSHGSVFLQENWDDDMNMETVAGIGYFIIRYIEKFQLDLGIGTGGDKSYPQIKFLPNNGYDHDATPEQIQKFEDAKRNLDGLKQKFTLDFC
jgi:hypothetical protein